jgi:AcrR family transcriptional regulator
VDIVAATPTRKQALTDLRRREILAAAIKAFGKKGFADTSVDDIAAAAKIAKGTLYLYFRSKEDIYSTALRQAIHELHALIAERLATAHGLRQKLSVIVSAHHSRPRTKASPPDPRNPPRRPRQLRCYLRGSRSSR